MRFEALLLAPAPALAALLDAVGLAPGAFPWARVATARRLEFWSGGGGDRVTVDARYVWGPEDEAGAPSPFAGGPAACRSVVATVDAHFGYDLEDPRRSRLGPPVIASSANATAAAALAAALVAFRRTPDPGACFAKLAKRKR